MTYSVKLTSLENAVTHADEVGNAISGLLNTLNENVQRTLATWTGDAQAAYRAQKTVWDNAAAAIPASLAQARSTLEAIAEQYDAAEKAAINAF
jgi:WXG100 family type VII secretion target